jgi:hypothetical protein
VLLRCPVVPCPPPIYVLHMCTEGNAELDYTPSSITLARRLTRVVLCLIYL